MKTSDRAYLAPPNDYTFDDPAELWLKLVPKYESYSLHPFFAEFGWDRRYGESIKCISSKRSANRVSSYLDPRELDRVSEKIGRGKKDVSIRFGAEKKGHGYSGERGDFCLVGGVYGRKTLTLLYRSIELIGGYGYDLVLLNELQDRLGLEIKTVRIWAARAFVFALRGNSNEKLYPKLQRIFKDGKD